MDPRIYLNIFTFGASLVGAYVIGSAILRVAMNQLMPTSLVTEDPARTAGPALWLLGRLAFLKLSIARLKISNFLLRRRQRLQQAIVLRFEIRELLLGQLRGTPEILNRLPVEHVEELPSGQRASTRSCTRPSKRGPFFNN
jgi:hypothetical protein